MAEQRTPKALIILDGFGSQDTDSSAINAANLPFIDQLMRENPNTQVATSGLAVGLPDGQMGNSEVGHMNIGAGRIIYQNLTRITKAVADGDFFTNSALIQAMDKAISQGKAVHITGLLSPGGVHSHEDHICALLEMAAQRGAKQLFLHAILDGRDMPPRSAQPSLDKVEQTLQKIGIGAIATVSGRYYAMDRDNRWDRVQTSFDAMTLGTSSHSATSASEALNNAYDDNKSDEFVPATVIHNDGRPVATVNDGDAVIFANFRPDRARELTRAFVDNESFDGFVRQRRPALADFVMLTEYAASIDANCAFPPSSITNDLGEHLSKLGKTQLRIAETEKYPHVTFFFNGGQEELYPGEERILIPSPDVATYDLQPEMSAYEVTDQLISAIHSQKFDLIICNFANGDMVGHTGNFDAAVKAVEVLDDCLAKVLSAMDEVNGETLITADHGNVEMMTNPKTGQPHTAHTIWPVPLIYTGPRASQLSLKEGALCDLAPSLLALMDLPQPQEMSGHSLIKFN